MDMRNFVVCIEVQMDHTTFGSQTTNVYAKLNYHSVKKKYFRSSVYDCTVEDVEDVSIVTHSHHLVVVITLPQ